LAVGAEPSLLYIEGFGSEPARSTCGYRDSPPRS
jgi:hypothetical protein